MFFNFLEDEFTKYISAYGEIFRWSLLFILSLAFVFLLLPFKKIWGSVADLSGGKNIIFRTFNFFIFYLLLALVLFALVCGAFFYLKKEKTEAPNYSELELAKWSEITWQIDLKIDEDKFINESLSITINAPALVIEGKRYLVCDFEKLGLNWKEITKGGVYNLSCTASQRKLNLSFKVQKLLVTGENLNIVLIELPILETESLKLLTASQKVNLNSIRLFSAKNSYRNADLDLSVNGKSIRLNKGGEAGDSLITKNGFYLGLLERDEKSLIAKYLEAEILNEAKQEIPLLKKENEVYYVDFMCRVSDIKKSLK